MRPPTSNWAVSSPKGTTVPAAAIRPNPDYTYVPRFRGFVDTNLGRGGIIDLIMDEGTLEISKTFEFYLKHGQVAAFDPLWVQAHRRILAAFSTTPSSSATFM